MRIGTAYVDIRLNLAQFNRDLQDAQNRLNTAVRNMQARSQSLTMSMKTLQQQQVQTAAGTNQVTTATKKARKGFMGLVPHVAAVTASYMAMRAAMRSIVSGVGVGVEFEQKMSVVKAITGSVGEEFEKLEMRAREMGRTTVFTAREAAEAMKYMAMAGFETAEILKAIPDVLNLALIGEMNLGRATDIATDTLRAFKLEAEDLATVVDVFVGAITRTNTNIEMMGQAMKFAAPVAAELGYQVEEVSAMIGILSQSGLKAGVAGRGLQQAFIRSTDAARKYALGPGSDVIDILEKTITLEKEHAKVVGETIARETAINDLRKSYGLVALKTILVLRSNIDAYKELANTLKYDVSGEAKRVSEIMHDNVSASFLRLKSIISDVSISVYGNFKDSIKGSIMSIVSYIDQNQSKIEKFLSMLARIAGNTAGASWDLISGLKLDKIAGHWTETVDWQQRVNKQFRKGWITYEEMQRGSRMFGGYSDELKALIEFNEKLDHQMKLHQDALRYNETAIEQTQKMIEDKKKELAVQKDINDAMALAYKGVIGDFSDDPAFQRALKLKEVKEEAEAKVSELRLIPGWSGVADEMVNDAVKNFKKLERESESTLNKVENQFKKYSNQLVELEGNKYDKQIAELKQFEQEAVESYIEHNKDVQKIYELTDAVHEHLLQKKYEAEAKAVDKTERLYERQLKTITRTSTEYRSVYEQLYDLTKIERYAQEAIKANELILKSEQEKWQRIGIIDQDAYTLRLKLQEEYKKKILGDNKEIAQSTAASSSVGHFTGLPVGPSTRFYEWRGQIFYDYNAMKSAMDAAKEKTDDLTVSTQSLADAYDAEAEALRNRFEGISNKFSGFLTGRNRANWGFNDYLALFYELSGGLGGTVNDEVLDTLDDMYDALQEMVSIEKDIKNALLDTVNAMADAYSAIGKLISDLGLGPLSPVESTDAHVIELMKRMSAAQAAIDLGDAQAIADAMSALTTYVPTFLEFAKGSSGNYSDIFDSVINMLRNLQDNALYSSIERLGSISDTAAGKVDTLADALGTDTGGLRKILEDAGIDVDTLAKKLNVDPDNLSSALYSASDETSRLESHVSEVLDKAITDFQDFVDVIGTQMAALPTQADVTAAVEAARQSIAETTNPGSTQYWQSTGASMDSYYGKLHQYRIMNPYTGETITDWFLFGNEPYSQWFGKPTYAGGLATSLGTVGEIGPEWVVPTYEPYRSAFLKDVGADPDKIGKSIAGQIGPLLSGMRAGSSGDVNVRVYLNGEEIGNEVGRQASSNSGMMKSLRRNM